MKKYLFVLRRAPNNGNHLQEMLDMILTTAAFDQSVSLLFMDDGVLQLRRGQNPEALGLKDTSAIFSVLEIYDVQELYVENESLSARGLNKDDLLLPVELLDRSEINALMSRYPVIVPD